MAYDSDNFHIGCVTLVKVNGVDVGATFPEGLTVTPEEEKAQLRCGQTLSYEEVTIGKNYIIEGVLAEMTLENLKVILNEGSAIAGTSYLPLSDTSFGDVTVELRWNHPVAGTYVQLFSIANLTAGSFGTQQKTQNGLNFRAVARTYSDNNFGYLEVV